MSCIGRKPPFNETLNVQVMHRLSSDLAIPMDFEPFLGKVWFALGIYISFSFGQDSRLGYQEYYGRQLEIQYHVNTKVGSFYLLHQGFQSCQLFSCVFKPHSAKKGFLPKMMGPEECDLTSNMGF